MKSFLISLAVFMIVTTFVFYCSWYVRNSCDTLLTEAQAAYAGEDLSALSAHWNKERVRFRAIVGHTEADPADEALEDMKSWSNSVDPAEFEAAKARFLSAVEGIRACEVFSFDSIF